MAGLVLDAQGNFYGTTSGGGVSSATCSNNYCGVVFKIDSAGNETVLYSFNGQPDGSNPQANVIQDAAGNLYGTTCAGGSTGNGTIFKLDSSGKETVLYSFAGQPDGSCPSAGVVLDAVDNLYGTTKLGGVSNDGTIFKLDTSDTETVLHSFNAQVDGKYPQDLLRDSAGNLYGAANRGVVINCVTGLRAIACGTIFKLTRPARSPCCTAFRGRTLRTMGVGPSEGWLRIQLVICTAQQNTGALGVAPLPSPEGSRGSVAAPYSNWTRPVPRRFSTVSPALMVHFHLQDW
jgi:uncharacterized repeat protein (TIGR03803 family)